MRGCADLTRPKLPASVVSMTLVKRNFVTGGTERYHSCGSIAAEKRRDEGSVYVCVCVCMCVYVCVRALA